MSNRAALGWALVCAALVSMLPVGVHLFAEGSDPFWFNSIFMTFISAGLAGGIVMSGGSLIVSTRQVVAAVVSMRQRGPRGWVTIAAMVAGTSNIGLFVLSAHHAGTVTAAVLYQLWPLCTALLLAKRGDSAPRRLSFGTAVLMGAAVAVTAMVIATQTPAGGGDGLWWAGVAAGAAAGILGGAVVSETIIVAYEALEARGDSAAVLAQEPAAAMPVMVAALMVACVCAVPTGVVLGVVGGGGVNAPAVITAAALGVCIAGSSMAARLAHFYSSGVGIFAVVGLDPVFGIVWLAIAGAGIANPPMFATGLILLMMLNTAIQTRDASTAAAHTAADSPR